MNKCNIYLQHAGTCAEYNRHGNRIQQSKINCTHFAHTPCPSGYSSTQAYKCKFLLLGSTYHFNIKKNAHGKL